MDIALKRAYEMPTKEDGSRILVDRLWPRGIRKEDLALDDWPKEVAPSNELRKWYQHDAEKWDEFKERYFRELSDKGDIWQPILQKAKLGKVTLIYSAKNTDYNNAIALREFLLSHSS